MLENPSELDGRSLRREGYSENIDPGPPIPPQKLHRFKRWVFPTPTFFGADEITPPPAPSPTLVNRLRRFQGERAEPRVLPGSARRRGGSPGAETPSGALVWLLRRFLRSPSPPGAPLHPSHALGRTLRRGAVVVWQEYLQTYQDGFRIADDSLAVYELYVGEDEQPDLHAAPIATSATLPFSWTPTPPPSGTKTLYCVVRQRNAYGLRSFNIESFKLQIDSSGTQTLIDPSAPVEVVVEDGSPLGYIRVYARYYSGEDPSPADTWEVYVGVGSAPDPDRSSGPDASQAMIIVGGEEAGLNLTVGAFNPGDTVYVIVVTKRSSDGAYGQSQAVQLTLANDLDLTDGWLFGGSVYEQR